MTKEQLKSLLESSLTNCNAIVESDDNVHFSAIITADDFEGIKSRVKRQQIVYSKINQHILSGEVHALSMKVIATSEKK